MFEAFSSSKGWDEWANTVLPKLLQVHCRPVGGRTAYHASAWRRLLADPLLALPFAEQRQLLNTVTEGTLLPLSDQPPLSCAPLAPRALSPPEAAQTRALLDELESKRAFRRLSAREAATPGFWLHAFSIPKADGSSRLIVDCRPLNAHLRTLHFKMESLATAGSMLQADDVLLGWDLSDAYLTLPLHPSHRHLCRVVAPDGSLWEPTVLFFGLSHAPHLFHTVTHTVVRFLRAQGLRATAYLDDFLLAAPLGDSSSAARQLALALGTLVDLGFGIHPRKQRLSWCHRTTHLGAVLDAHSMTVRLPSDKLAALRRDARYLLSRPPTLARLASFVGLANFCRVALPQGALWLRPLVRFRSACLRTIIASTGRPHAVWQTHAQQPLPTPIPPDAVQALEWWGQIHATSAWAPLAGLQPVPPATRYVLTTDASPYGIGATLTSTAPTAAAATPPPLWVLSEQLPAADAAKHHNIREALALQRALSALPDQLLAQVRDRRRRFTPLLVQTDNTTLLSHINRAGGRSSSVSRLVEQILHQAFALGLELRARFLPGKDNSAADHASRALAASQWALHPELFTTVERNWGPFQVDLFASRQHHLTEQWISAAPDPQALAVDALQCQWPSHATLIAVPPPALIGPLLERLRQQRQSELTLIAPLWVGCRWWTTLCAMLSAPPMLLVPSRASTVWDPQHPPPPTTSASYSRWRWAAFRLSSP